MLEKIFAKILSGRFLLTIMAGVVFVYATVTKALAPEAIAAILMGVFTSYFDRKDRNGDK
jgi:hypothetical protein